MSQTQYCLVPPQTIIKKKPRITLGTLIRLLTGHVVAYLDMCPQTMKRSAEQTALKIFSLATKKCWRRTYNESGGRASLNRPDQNNRLEFKTPFVQWISSRKHTCMGPSRDAHGLTPYGCRNSKRVFFSCILRINHPKMGQNRVRLPFLYTYRTFPPEVPHSG